MSELVSHAALAMMGVLSVAILLALYRVLRGPSLPDRVIAIDLLTTLAVGIIALYAIVTGQKFFLSAGIALALLAFLGTVALALYIRRGDRPADAGGASATFDRNRRPAAGEEGLVRGDDRGRAQARVGARLCQRVARQPQLDGAPPTLVQLAQRRIDLVDLIRRKAFNIRHGN